LKKIIIAMFLVAMMSYGQEMTKQKVMFGGGFAYTMTTTDPSQESKDFVIPNLGFQFERMWNDMFKLYFYGDLGYEMSKYTIDGEAPLPEDGYSFDCFAKVLYGDFDIRGKFYLPNNLFVTVGMPMAIAQIWPQIEDTESARLITFDGSADFGFDNREIEMHMLSPWDKFEKGMAFYGSYTTGLVEVFDSQKTEELASYFSLNGVYAYMMENMMVRPYVVYRMQLNEYFSKSSDLVLGAAYAQDFSEQLNLEANLGLTMHMLEDKDEFGDDTINYFGVSGKANYYLTTELCVFGGMGVNKNLTTKDAEPTYVFSVGAVYTIDELKK